jgi:hypothetical protein
VGILTVPRLASLTNSSQLDDFMSEVRRILLLGQQSTPQPGLASDYDFTKLWPSAIENAQRLGLGLIDVELNDSRR